MRESTLLIVIALLCALTGCQSPRPASAGPGLVVTYRDDGTPSFVGIRSQTERRAAEGREYEIEIGSDGQPATGPHIVLGPGGRVLSLVVYEQGKPVTAWSGYGGRWEQRMMQGTGWIDFYDLDGNLHESYHYFDGAYTHGVH